MQPSDFDDEDYSCMPLEILMSADWKDKPTGLWSDEDWSAYLYQERLRIRQEMLDIRFDID